jgi:hypothetical protein
MCLYLFDELCNDIVSAMIWTLVCNVYDRCDHHTEESYIGECWSNLKQNQVLEEPLRVDACLQSSKLFHTKGLCAPWTMKSFQGPVKSQDHFGLHQGQNARVTMEFEIPKRHISRLTLFIDMVQRIFVVGEAKEAV